MKSLNSILVSIALAIIYALATTGIFLFYISRENFGSLLPSSISKNGFLSIDRFLLTHAIDFAIALTALTAALALMLVVFSWTRLGSHSAPKIVGLFSISVSTLMSWTGGMSEFSNGQLFRTGTGGNVDPVRMFVFVISISVALTIIFSVALLALMALFDFFKKKFFAKK